MLVVYVFVEVRIHKQDIFQQTPNATVVAKCTAEMKEIKSTMVKSTNWETHSHILRLLKFARFEVAVEVRRYSLETIAVLSYLDQMTAKNSFFSLAPDTCMTVYLAC